MLITGLTSQRKRGRKVPDANLTAMRRAFKLETEVQRLRAAFAIYLLMHGKIGMKR